MIGGIFPVENKLNQPNAWFTHWPGQWDLVHMMSGRCALTFCLLDYLEGNSGKRCYVPSYTCETVLAPYRKLGMELIFYDFNSKMEPVFDRNLIGKFDILHIAGYYGFSNYSRSFLDLAKAHSAVIVQDITHSMFSSNGLDPLADYAAGSARKWLGVASGGVAYKKGSDFNITPLPVDNEHIARRLLLLEGASALQSPTGDSTAFDMEKRFWAAEGMLRKMFSYQASDAESIEIMEHFDVATLQNKRRSNYRLMLELINLKLPEFTEYIVFPELDDDSVPSHFTILYPERNKLQNLLLDQGIKTTVYWPDIPEGCEEFASANIYRQVLSLPIDQRYGNAEMEAIVDALVLAHRSITATA